MTEDEEFQMYLRAITKPDTDSDFVRRNYGVLKAAYLRNGVVKLPEVEAKLVQTDRYADLD
ncbi:hypothetical protein ASE85_02425 [Sphingobium sp. Leaf26]|uniref:hypothetical protein n=1 Tax=Sphingobium sp. Leaf26 TaxID=1735693 RepID=UPI0006F75B04|nr:hypothetical protein [Sphingobium sp. Leaf26]KQN09811.1 hypothetical protein ASE85_02425 [Sphingobium sp. Leaf26]